VIKNYCYPVMEITFVNHHPDTGTIDIQDLRHKLTADVAGYYFENPSYFGIIEHQAEEISALLHENGSLLIVGADPVSLGVLTPPVQYGADIACGDIQPLGMHLNYGGGASGHPTGNPLLPGGLVPFSDPYHPRSPIIQFVQDGTASVFPSNNLSGRVDIVAQAADTTDLWSSIDMNNGIYTIGWALYSADTSTVLNGPHFWFEADELYSNSYINNVLFKFS